MPRVFARQTLGAAARRNNDEYAVTGHRQWRQETLFRTRMTFLSVDTGRRMADSLGRKIVDGADSGMSCALRQYSSYLCMRLWSKLSISSRRPSNSTALKLCEITAVVGGGAPGTEKYFFRFPAKFFMIQSRMTQ